MPKNREADQTMSAHMKNLGIERTSGRCPICNQAINIGYPQERSTAMSAHMMPGNCKGAHKPVTGIRKGNNHTDFLDVLAKHKGKVNFHGMVHADLLGMGWSDGRIRRAFATVEG